MVGLPPAAGLPDRFVLVRTDYGTIILAGWYGSYLGAESWRLSTPIKKVVLEDGGLYMVTTNSRSVYSLRLDRYGLTSLTAGVFSAGTEQAKDGHQLWEMVEFEGACSELLRFA